MLKIVLWIAIIILLLIIIASYIIFFSPYKTQIKFWDDIKTKRGRIILIILSPFIFYVFITLVLILVRDNSFVGYYVTSDTIYYNGAYYTEVTDEAKKEEIYAYGDGYWTYMENYILSEKPSFPFFEYWIPDLFFEQVIFCTRDIDRTYIMLQCVSERTYFERQ